MPSDDDKTGTHPGDIRRSVREQLLRMLVEELEEGVANLSTSGKILYANSRFAQLMNARPERGGVVGRNLRELISAGSWDDLNTALTQGACGPVKGEIKVDTERGGRGSFAYPSAPCDSGNKQPSVP